MSWIFGKYTPGKRAHSENLYDFREIPNVRVFSDHGAVKLAIGGIRETLCSGRILSDSGTPFEQWLVAGFGLIVENGQYRKAGDRDWSEILSADTPDLSRLNGHFICFRWNDEKLEIFTDPLGLRTLYFAEMGDNVFFSTRLDRIANATGFTAVDYRVFGSRWHCYNQFSTRSVIKDIVRLGPGGHAVITRDAMTVTESPWINTPCASNGDSPQQILSSLVTSDVIDGSGLALALSGGLDSRALLSILLGKESPPVSAMTLGSRDHPDAGVASRIIRDNKLERFHFDETIPGIDTLLELLTEYTAHTQCIAPASAVLLLRHYSELYRNGKFLFDGGFGEIGRRMFKRRLRVTMV